MRSRDELRQITEEMLRRHPAAEAELKRLPGVVSVGVGLRETAGVLTQELVWRVYVERKKPLRELPVGEVIPAEVQGFPTDVILRLETRPIADEDKYRPLRGGIQIGNGSGAVGTLGVLAQLQDGSGKWVALSNHHVMMAGGKNVGDHVEIGQSDLSTCCCCSCGGIGTVLAAHIGGLTDCAICSINDDVAHHHEIQGIGPVTGWTGALPGETVRKRGRTTGLTTGTVSDVNYNTTSTAGDAFTNQLLIAPTGVPNMVLPGDSGSAVVDADVKVVGLIWGQNGANGVASQIMFVRTELNIDIPGAEGIAPVLARLEKRRPVSRLEALRAHFSETPAYRIFERQQPEVMHLINHNRACKLAWQRKQGPAFTAAFVRSLKEPAYRVPLQINGIRAESLLWAMAAVLEEQGSDRLRKALLQFAPAVLQAAADGISDAEVFLENLALLTRYAEPGLTTFLSSDH